MKLVAGLGNHGKEYVHTRHNFGWDVVTAFAEKYGASFQEKSRFQAEIAELSIEGEKILCLRPLTYMNRSGDAVEAVLSFYKLDRSSLLVVHDEMDYPLGKMAFCAQAGPAGNNGIRSIQERLGTEEVARLRLGIGRPTSPQPKEDFVLQRFSEEEQEATHEVMTRSVCAIETWIKEGTDRAMNTWNVARI